MEVELNIGLNVAEGNNSFEARTERAEAALRLLGSRFSHISNRLTTTYDKDGVAQIEDTLVVALRNVPEAFVDVLHRTIFDVAVALDQDCVAAYFSATSTGILVGPNADAWGEFNLEYFRRTPGLANAA